MTRMVWYRWPESQACIGCRHVIFLSDDLKYGSSAYQCGINHINVDVECSEYKLATKKEWEKKFE